MKMFCRWLTGNLDNLQSPYKTLVVIGMNDLGVLRVDSFKLGQHRIRPFILQSFLKRCPHFRIASRFIKKTPRHCSVIETTTATNDGNFATTFHLIHGHLYQLSIFTGGDLL